MEERPGQAPPQRGTADAKTGGNWAVAVWQLRGEAGADQGSEKQIPRSARDDNRREMEEAVEQYTFVRLHAREGEESAVKEEGGFPGR